MTRRTDWRECLKYGGPCRDPLKVQITTTAGTLTITMDNKWQTSLIQAPVKIGLKAGQSSLQGAKVEVNAGTVEVNSTGPCTVQALPIKLS